MFTEKDFLGGRNCTSCGRPVRAARPGFDATPDRCLECRETARLTGPPPAPGPPRPERSKESEKRGGTWTGLILLPFLLLVAAGCEQEASPEWREVAQRAAARAAADEAEARFDPAAFDTISWRSTYARGERGRVVYDHSCAKCHGADGTGNGSFARERGFEVESIVRAGWLYYGDVPAIRKRIFTGHGPEMPTWGLTELSYRDIDAVAFFLDERLPERTAPPDR